MALGIGTILGVAGKAAGAVAKGASSKSSGMGGKTSAAIGLGAGIGQGIAGMIKKRKADAMLPAEEDPTQSAMQRQFARQKRALQTGTANQAERSALKQMMQSGIKESFKRGAGARGLNAMNQMYQQGVMNLNAQNANQATEYAKMEGGLVNTMAQRKLELGMERYDREQARSAQLLTDAKRNVGSSLSRLLK